MLRKGLVQGVIFSYSTDTAGQSISALNWPYQADPLAQVDRAAAS